MNLNLKKIPNTPGIYKFFSKSEIIYIGKAKNLKKRVTSYFRSSFQDRKTSQIKILTDKIETFTTKNEVEALLLEQLLIKENKPKFNILLRDDKTYPYIYFSLDHQFPGIYLKRTKQATNSNYFSTNLEDGVVILNKKDREIFKDKYPEEMKRIDKRREFIINQIGINLKPEVMPLSNIPCYLSPYILNFSKAIVAKN